MFFLSPEKIKGVWNPWVTTAAEL